MLLTVDIGNTQIAVGLFETAVLRAHWRIATRLEMTEDELAAVFSDLLDLENLKLPEVDAVAIGSVVPGLTASFTAMAKKYMKVEPLIVGAGIDTGIPVRYRNPEDVGADRIANAVAGYEKFGGPLVIVDFGTATTFDAVSGQGEYVGGAIAPGILVSAEALFRKAARLSETDLAKPTAAIGKDTGSSIQSGIILGTAGMVDSLVGRISDELGGAREVVATGGLSEMIATECATITRLEPYLTLEGLRIIYEKNR